MEAYHLIVSNEVATCCGPTDGGKYDLSDACLICGTGARRIDPIKLPVHKLKDCVSLTYFDEVVIPPRLVPAIKAVAPQCLREIHDGKTGLSTSFSELIPETMLPPWGATTTGWCRSDMDPPCTNCKRDGYFGVPKVSLKLVYDKAILPFQVAATYEHFGKSRLLPDFKKSLLSMPRLVISESIKNILINERGLSFEVVKLPEQSEPSKL